MADLGFTLNDTDYAPSQRSFENLPDGDYLLELEKSDLRPTTDGSGQYLAMTYNVIEPEEFSGRKIFTNINIINPNPQTEKWGREELTALKLAVGYEGELSNTEHIHFMSFVGKVGMEKKKEGSKYEPRNKIKFYYPKNDGPPAAANDNTPAAQRRAATPAPANDNRPPVKAAGSRPWDKKVA